MAADHDKKRKARSAFIYKRKTLALIALEVGVAANTVSRWKRAAKLNGDDWEIARTAHMIAGEGLDVVITHVVEEFMIMAQNAIEELKVDNSAPLANRISQMTSLADAMNKMTVSAGKLAPKISELGVAQDVIRRLMEFVRDQFPEHAAVMLEITEPFGENLVEAFG